jgi:isoquinoline 1-oxidoreductase alpha subunit
MIFLTVNGKLCEVDAAPDTPLLWVIREQLNLTGTKFGCGMAQCGACTVHVDGMAVRSCVTPVSSVAGKSVTTIEAVSATAAGRAVQQAWIAEDVPQCGYCQSGHIMEASALLAKMPKPSDLEIDDALNGNLCRCGTYPRIRKAVRRASNDLERGAPAAAPRKAAPKTTPKTAPKAAPKKAAPKGTEKGGGK